METAWDVEIVADSDTRWKWGATIAARLAGDRPVRTHATLLLGRSVPNEQQLDDVGIEPDTLRRAGVAATVARLADSDAQVVVLACIGGGVQSLLHALARAWSGRRERPVVVTGYVGLVYEKIVDGLLARAGADVVLANSAQDAERFRATYSGVGVDPGRVVQTALPFLGGLPHDPQAAGRERPFTVTFVTQPGVPETKAERRYALLQAVEHANRHPDRHVLVKLRGRVGERTTHVEPYNYASLRAARQLPANLQLVHGAMGPVLDRTDLCLTVSSTAAIEAMHRHIPTGILTDFGIRESLGNQLFLGSGAFTSWRAVHAGALPATDPHWAARNGVHDPDPYAALRHRVAELVEQRTALAPLRPWLDPEDAAAYLPGLLARYGLDPHGVPLAPGRAGGAEAPLRTRAVRAAARRVYGVGVRVVEPRIKRLAQI
ncbi:MAG: hypothetical protein QOC66_2261 [Pseudonocardiales bacterium]|nr:hypothetical protein [Pseudonocardiales bacterium]